MWKTVLYLCWIEVILNFPLIAVRVFLQLFKMWRKASGKNASLNMKAGEALFYDHALIHGSPPNHTDTIRVGIVMGMMPANASMRLYTAGSNGIEEYESVTRIFSFLISPPMPRKSWGICKPFLPHKRLSQQPWSPQRTRHRKTESAQKKPNLFVNCFQNWVHDHFYALPAFIYLYCCKHILSVLAISC